MAFRADTLLLRLKLLRWFTLSLYDCDFVNIRGSGSSFGSHVTISTLARIVGNIFPGYLTIAKVTLFASSPCGSRILSLFRLVLLRRFTSGTANSSPNWSSCRWLIRIPGISHELLVRVARTTWIVTILIILDVNSVFFTLRALVVITLSLINFIFILLLSLSRVSCRITLMIPILCVITLTVVGTRNATLIGLIFGVLCGLDCF